VLKCQTGNSVLKNWTILDGLGCYGFPSVCFTDFTDFAFTETRERCICTSTDQLPAHMPGTMGLVQRSAERLAVTFYMATFMSGALETNEGCCSPLDLMYCCFFRASREDLVVRIWSQASMGGFWFPFSSPANGQWRHMCCKLNTCVPLHACICWP
jgi:hypothetical protein